MTNKIKYLKGSEVNRKNMFGNFKNLNLTSQTSQVFPISKMSQNQMCPNIKSVPKSNMSQNLICPKIKCPKTKCAPKSNVSQN